MDYSDRTLYFRFGPVKKYKSRLSKSLLGDNRSGKPQTLLLLPLNRKDIVYQPSPCLYYRSNFLLRLYVENPGNPLPKLYLLFFFYRHHPPP